MFDVDFYRLPDGKAPVESFLNGLNAKMRAKALHSISILEEFGNNLREPTSKPMGGGLFELRIQFAGDISRIFYFFVVTNGFIKKTMKTPKSELTLARKYKADYERRQNHE